MENLSDKLFAILSVVIIVVATIVFYKVFSSEIPDLKVTKNGVPLLISDAINPENGKPISIDELVIHYKGM